MTKIVATLGPASDSPERLARARRAPGDATRRALNFSHGTHEDHAERARSACAQSQDEVGTPLALIADLQGPKLRIGELDEPRHRSCAATTIVDLRARSVAHGRRAAGRSRP